MKRFISEEIESFEVLKDGKTWTNAIATEPEAIEEITTAQKAGYRGKFTYRGIICLRLRGEEVTP